jgi:hypothetical protein
MKQGLMGEAQPQASRAHLKMKQGLMGNAQ